MPNINEASIFEQRRSLPQLPWPHRLQPPQILRRMASFWKLQVVALAHDSWGNVVLWLRLGVNSIFKLL